MATAFYIDTTQLLKGATALKTMSKELGVVIDDVLTTNTLEIEQKAKRNAPTDRGLIRQSISSNTSGHLKKEINVNAFYAAYMEFGTGAYAARYAASLPATYRAYAMQFKGKAGGTFAEMVRNLEGWVKRKGIAKGKSSKSMAYVIARSILIKGVRPHPFLIPAVISQQPILVREMEAAIKALIK